VKGTRKTHEGKSRHLITESQRIKNEKIFKATLKKKDEDSDGESAEEDIPAIKIEDLLADLKI
jgi:hypothetical protein